MKLEFLVGFIVGYLVFKSITAGILMGFFFLFLSKNIKNSLGNRAIKSIHSRFFGLELNSSDYFSYVTFYVLGLLSKSKGVVTSADIDYTYSVMRALRVSELKKNELIESFRAGKDGKYNLKELMSEFVQVFAHHQQILNLFFDYQLQLVFNDGKLQYEEEVILRTISLELGMSEADYKRRLLMFQAAQMFKGRFQNNTEYGHQHGSHTYQQQSSQRNHQYDYRNEINHSDSLEEAYNILGVQASDDFSTVKKAYRRLMNEYHPDKMAAKNVPSGVLEVAKEKSQQIIKAYRLICDHKNWK